MARIDSLTPGSSVTLSFKTWGTTYEERAIFIKIIGEGNDRKARFLSVNSPGEQTYEWDAYRYQGRWVYGSSAQALSLASVDWTI
jgi:hypothetical protein